MTEGRYCDQCLGELPPIELCYGTDGFDDVLFCCASCAEAWEELELDAWYPEGGDQ